MGMKHVIVLILSSLTTRELGIFSYAYWLPNILFRSLSVSLAIFIELFVYYVCSFLFFLFFFLYSGYKYLVNYRYFWKIFSQIGLHFNFSVDDYCR